MLNSVLKSLKSNNSGHTMDTPNLFKFAPSELSQDAFFAWLISFADKKYQHEFSDLHQVAQSLLLAFIKKCLPNFKIDIQTVAIQKQHKHIDIVVLINDNFRILIESKTNSKEHGNQLKRYGEYAISQNWDFIGIYLKTGNEPNHALKKIPDKTKELGMVFNVFSRQDILNIFKNYKHIDNSIFLDYFNYLQEIENKTNSYRESPIQNWYSRSWQGFYQYLEEKNMVYWWDDINNKDGKIWGANLAKILWNDISITLGIRQNKLAFIITVTDKSKQNSMRNDTSKLLLQHAHQNGLTEIIKPKRFGSGKFMAIAEIQQEHWLGQNDEIVNLDEVVAKLKRYQDFLLSFQDN